MVFALSVLDLPLESEAAEVNSDETAVTILAKSPTFIFKEQIRETTAAEELGTILVSQNFFKNGDRYRQVEGQQVDKFVTGEFLTETVYGCHIVITNPTSARRDTDVLIQVPAGAIPVSNGQVTKTIPVTLDAYRTETIEYYFYFPAAGSYSHYPVQVSEDEKVVVSAEPATFKVVNDPTSVDRESWDYVSQFASNQDVLSFLQKNNLQQLDLTRIAFRMKDKAFFEATVNLLSQNHRYDNTLWSYGIEHNVAKTINQFLQHHDSFVSSVGAYLDSPLLSVDPVVRKSYQHMEYKPLVNARVHQLGRDREILNDRFHEQYVRLASVLSCRRVLDQDDLMTVTYYLLLQDRIEEAMDFFGRIQPDQLATRMQYDYCAAYLDCFSPEPMLARSIASKYANYPVDRWRLAFASIQNLVDEIDGKDANLVNTDDRDQRQQDLAAKEPTFEMEIKGDKLVVRHRNLEQLELNCYLMDLELLFSRNPFVQQYAKQFSHIRPNYQQSLDLDASGTTEILLPEDLRNANVLVELTAAGKTRSVANYANTLSVQISENYGQLQVNEQANDRPLSTTYIKVYAQMQDGSVRFYKDGYTDLRGRFDYTSLSTNELDNVQKFSILVVSESNGALVREATPPKR